MDVGAGVVASLLPLSDFSHVSLPWLYLNDLLQMHFFLWHRELSKSLQSAAELHSSPSTEVQKVMISISN